MRAKTFIMTSVTTLLILGVGAPAIRSQAPAQKASRIGEEVLANWNEVHRKLIAMAEDFPEDKYEYKPTPEVRTFAAVLLHVSGTNFGLINALSGKKMGPADNDPSRSVYKTKADIVALLKKSAADGAALIKKDAERMMRVVKEPDSGNMMTETSAWMSYCEHSGEHYGQLVVYYRMNGLVPPESRPRPK